MSVQQIGLTGLAGAAGKYIKGKSVGKGYDVLTAAEVVEDLNVKALNADGGFTFTTTTTPTINIDTYFGGGAVWKSAHKLASSSAALVSEDDRHYTASITRTWVGNEGPGGSAGGLSANGALFLEARHSDYLTNENYGQTVTLYLSMVAGRRDNHSAMQIGAAKVFDGTYDGSVSCIEGRVYRYNAAGATLERGGFLIGWSMANTGVNYAPNGSVMFTAETDIGPLFGGFAAVEHTDGFTWPYSAAADRNNTSMYFGVTGSNHVAGAGLVRASGGAVANPAYSFINDPDTGLLRGGPDLIVLAAGGFIRLSISTSLVATGVSMHVRNGTAMPAGGTAGFGLLLSSVNNFGIFFGSGAPTLQAAKGSKYMRSDGSGTNDREYINTDGGTTWTAVVTVA